MFSTFFRTVTEEDKNIAIENIIEHASPRSDFFLMLVLSASMATFGVMLGDVIVLIASMLIAPLLYPILSFALGISVADEVLVRRSFVTFTKSVGLVLMASAIIGFLFAPRDGFVSMGFLGDVSPLSYALVALIAGFAGTFALVKPRLSETLPGVAIAVALVPPLARAGVGFALLDWALVSSALLLFVVNAIGIVCASMIVFSMLHFAFKKRVAQAAVARDEAEVIGEVIQTKRGGE